MLKQQAVLFRASHHCGPLEVELTRSNIPFVKFGGLKFLDAAHIKDMLALLRFVENPRDRVAGFRVMQLIPGMGPARRRAVLDHMTGTANPIKALLMRLRRRARQTTGTLRRDDQRRARWTGGWPAELERARQWYEPHLERLMRTS